MSNISGKVCLTTEEPQPAEQSPSQKVLESPTKKADTTNKEHLLIFRSKGFTQKPSEALEARRPLHNEHCKPPTLKEDLTHQKAVNVSRSDESYERGEGSGGNFRGFRNVMPAYVPPHGL
ncbi:hypothetical protein M5689_013182 [Euphorbia peplus]|nr:hypothetical protein M5689_013182 [Euphorbia peplus]